MEDKELQKIADSLRDKASEKKKVENESATKNRFAKVLSKRDEAMRAIHAYQDKTGIPESEEIDTEFMKNAQ